MTHPDSPFEPRDGGFLGPLKDSARHSGGHDWRAVGADEKLGCAVQGDDLKPGGEAARPPQGVKTMAYRVFVRNWWRRNPNWPGGREPDASGPQRTIARRVETEAEARSIAKQYNATHDPGLLSRKAEYTSR